MLISWADALPADLKGVVEPRPWLHSVPITGRDNISVWGTSTERSTVDIWRFF